MHYVYGDKSHAQQMKFIVFHYALFIRIFAKNTLDESLCLEKPHCLEEPHYLEKKPRLQGPSAPENIPRLFHFITTRIAVQKMSYVHCFCWCIWSKKCTENRMLIRKPHYLEKPHFLPRLRGPSAENKPHSLRYLSHFLPQVCQLQIGIKIGNVARGM